MAKSGTDERRISGEGELKLLLALNILTAKMWSHQHTHTHLHHATQSLNPIMRVGRVVPCGLLLRTAPMGSKMH